ncbi:alpha/beta fold hydrolase [Tropicimonas sp. IMCC34011]|uniref:alpha/beta fold hydrolase n=1 Tax=Tropicimonas sp. IMCC34011 TaxID=2248759 RepID=UPI000E232AE1|nr:alpha/beta hydrolase [Tropicimonas sp. IMCC34011]
MKRRAALGFVGLGLALAACAVPKGPPKDDVPGSRVALIGKAALDYPPTGQLLQIGNTTVHAHVEGTGPDLILIHGASGNTRDFTFSLVGKLKDRYRVIAFDRPGLGHTEPIAADGGSPAEQARLLDVAAERLGVKKAIVLGQSYGGAVAMAWALERPERVAGLVIVSGATMPWEGGLGPQYALMSGKFGGAVIAPLASTIAIPPVERRALNSVFAPQDPPEGYREYLGIPLSLRPHSVRANARQIFELKGALLEMAPDYPGIEVPAELIHGTADKIVPIDVHSRRLVKILPNASLTELPGIGHMPHHVAQEQVLAAIDRVAAKAWPR